MKFAVAQRLKCVLTWWSSSNMIRNRRKTVVVVGNGMVGQRFCERLIELDCGHDCKIVTFSEEPRPAYDRVNLTKFFEHRNAGKLALVATDWYDQNDVTLFIGDRAIEIDRTNRVVRSARPRDRLRRRRAGHRVGTLRAAGAGHRQERRLRLPYH